VAPNARGRIRFWIEALTAGLSAFLALLTLVTREWIEAILQVDPDHGNGSAEWLIVVVLGVIAVVTGALARRDWVRFRQPV